MPKARHRKETSFQNTVTRSVFLYGKPNTGKRSVLEHMVSAFTELVNRDIRLLDSTPGIFLQLVKNDKKDTEMRKLEKTLRVPGYNSAFCQNAFDQAVTHLSNRLDSIRTEMISSFGIFARSKVLFAMSVSGSSREQMVFALAAIGQKFHKDCIREIQGLTDREFSFLMKEFADQYAMLSMEYRIPQLKSVSVPLDSRLMKIETSVNTSFPYVISITDPFTKRKRIAVPLDNSRHSLHKIHSHRMAGTVLLYMKGQKARIGWSYDTRMETPEEISFTGVDTGILDAFSVSDGRAIGSMTEVLGYYHDEVEPAFAVLSDLRNKKASIKHYLHSHDLPEDVGRSLIHKMDRLDQMMQSMEAPYRKKRRYYGLLEEEISKDVRTYISGLEKGTVTVLEKLDIKEFRKSRKLNGKLSTFARGKLQQKLMEGLNEKGYTFLEVEPDYTSQLCPVCSSLDPDNRDGKTFLCTCCGHRDDADHNASVNIRDRASDKEVLDICMEHRYNRKSMQEHLKIVYASRHEKYRTHTASA